MNSLKHLPSPKPIDDFDAWLATFTQPTVLVELLVLALSVAVAWGLVAALRRTLGMQEGRSIWFGKRVIDGVLFPLA